MQEHTKLRRWRTVSTSKICRTPPSPVDSGYGSGDSLSLEAKHRVRRRPRFLDGTAENDGRTQEEDENDEGWHDSICAERWASDTVPTTPIRIDPIVAPFESETLLPSHFYTPERHPTSALPTRSKSYPLRRTPVREPDRFVPTRDQTAPLSETFLAAKPISDLSSGERLLRSGDATPDVFHHRSPTVGLTGPDLPLGTPTVARRGPIPTTLDNQPARDDDGTQSLVDSLRTLSGLGTPLVDDGRGRFLRSGTNAQVTRASFSRQKHKPENHDGRLASALDLDRVRRVLNFQTFSGNLNWWNRSKTKRTRAAVGDVLRELKTTWNGTEWVTPAPSAGLIVPAHERGLGKTPFRVLDAPGLKDDFYCSVIAYSPTCQTLAVALGNTLYAWTETSGATVLHRGGNTPLDNTGGLPFITSLSCSSVLGQKSILAIGRSNGNLGLLSLRDSPLPRLNEFLPHAVMCLSWRPVSMRRLSRNPAHPHRKVETEDLLVGDQLGIVSYFVVEWPEPWEVERDTWPGSLTMVARIHVHTQQICGLAWSPEGDLFATGGNDNACCLFETRTISPSDGNGVEADQKHREQQEAQQARLGTSEVRFVRKRRSISEPLPLSGSLLNRLRYSHGLPNVDEGTPSMRVSVLSDRSKVARPVPISPPAGSVPPPPPSTPVPVLVRHFWPGSEKHQWTHGSAVKAIAFCPWREGLIATGGGSNDMGIHFYHTTSGAALASITVAAQVTSLIWSTTRREIAATFGYAQPDHPVRIAVFAWPDCREVAAIPWEDANHRALYAIPYPSRLVGSSSLVLPPVSRESIIDGASSHALRREEGREEMSDENKTRGRKLRPAQRPRRYLPQDGCIVVAASDQSIKFHEVWEADNPVPAGGPGTLAGSDILEDLEGIDKEGDIIR